LDTLSQTTTLGFTKTFETGTNFQSSFSASKLSTNSILSTLNPSIATDLQFTVTQPLLRKFGLFPNRAPILIAQRNLKQARASFQGQVNEDRKSTRLNSSHLGISYAVFCLKK